MSTINCDVKTEENCKIIDAINYLGILLKEMDIELYSKFIEESFIDNRNQKLEIIYFNLLEKLKHLKF